MKKIIFFCGLLSAAFFTAQTAGTLDTSFGTGGKVVGSSAVAFNYIQASVQQADGKIVSVGKFGDNMAIFRFNTDGTLDTTFGTTGVLSVNVSSNSTNEVGNAVAIQSDGKILIGGHSGSTSNPYVVLRIFPNGTLDTLFGTLGFSTFGFSFSGGSQSTGVKDIKIQPDGKIVVVGTADNTTTIRDISVARLLVNGTLDVDFSNDGKTTFHETNADIGLKSKILSDGSILVAGTSNFEKNLKIIKYFPDGSLDTSYGTAGVMTYTNPAISSITSIKFLDNNDMLVGAGTTTVADAVVFKLSAAGVLDTTFGVNGIRSVDFDNGSNDSAPNDIITDALNNIYAVGTSISSGSTFMNIMCLTNSGALNNAFSFDGKLFISFTTPSYGAEAFSALIQTDSKLVVSGVFTTPSKFALARFFIQDQTLNTLEVSNSSLNVYPNPARDFIYVAKENLSLENEVKIIDGSGRVVLMKVVNKNDNRINVSSLKAGIYYLMLNGKSTKIIIK